MTWKYTSPLRPLDIGVTAKAGDVEIDWDHTDIGPDDNFTLATRIYAFTGPLPDALVEHFTLKFAGN